MSDSKTAAGRLAAAVRQRLVKGLGLRHEQPDCPACGLTKQGLPSLRQFHHNVLRWQPFTQCSGDAHGCQLDSLAAMVTAGTGLLASAFAQAFPRGIPDYTLSPDQVREFYKLPSLSQRSGLRVLENLLFKQVASSHDFHADWPGTAREYNFRVVDNMQLQYCLARENLAPMVYGCVTTTDKQHNKWIAMDFVRGPPGQLADLDSKAVFDPSVPVDLDSGKALYRLPLAAQGKLVANFTPFLTRALAALGKYHIVHSDFKPANIVCTPNCQFLLIDLDPFYCLQINNMHQETNNALVVKTIMLSNALNLLASGLGVMPPPYQRIVYDHVAALLGPVDATHRREAGQDTFTRCVHWWWNSLRQSKGVGNLLYAGCPPFLALQYLYRSEAELSANVPAAFPWLPRPDRECWFLQEKTSGRFRFRENKVVQQLSDNFSKLQLNDVEQFVAAIICAAAQQVGGQVVTPQTEFNLGDGPVRMLVESDDNDDSMSD